MVATHYGDSFGEDFQRHILAVMCLVPGFVIRFRTALDFSYFVDDTDRSIASALLAHVDKQKKLPTMATLIEDIRPTVGKTDMPAVEKVLRSLYARDVSDATAVIEKTVDFGRTQALVNAVLAAAKDLDRNEVGKIRPRIDEALLVGQDLLDVGIDYREQVDDRYEWYTNPEVALRGLRTGITHLDLMMEGGLCAGELGVVLAPPKRGKSTLLVNIGFGALTSVDPKNVVHYSCEMDRKKVAMRYDDRLMGDRVKFKRSDPERYFVELQDRTSRLLRGQLFVQSYPTRTASISTIRAHLALLASRGFKPDLVIVDYADIMKPERRLGEMRHEQAGIYEDLRALAGEFECPVWTGSQAKISALDKEVVTLQDFAETSEKSAIVDAAIALCQTPDERLSGRARIFGAGLRDHEDGRTVEILLRRDCCYIRSTGLLDAGGTRIAGEDTRKTVVKATIEEAQKKSRLKAAGGITKKTIGGGAAPGKPPQPAWKKKQLTKV